MKISFAKLMLIMMSICSLGFLGLMYINQSDTNVNVGILELFYPHLESIFYIALLAGFVSILAAWYVGIDIYREDEGAYIFEGIAICSIIIACLVLGGILSCMDQNLAVEKQVAIEDKWNEGNNYYFADTKGNVYTMEYDLRDKGKTKKYSKLRRTRYNSLVIGEYTVECFNRSNVLISIGEKKIVLE